MFLTLLLGIGLFMTALHDLSVGMKSEKELFSQCLIPELQELGRGIVFTTVNEEGKEIEVFLQARVIFHVMDTKAFEKIANVQG